MNYRFKKVLSFVCLVAAIGFGIAGFYAPPKGEISGSVLILIAQFLTASGTFIGLDVYINKINEQLKNLQNGQF